MKRNGTRPVPRGPRQDFSPLIDSAAAYTKLVRALGDTGSATTKGTRSVTGGVAKVTGQKAINIVGASASGAANTIKGRDASGAPKSIRPPAKRKK